MNFMLHVFIIATLIGAVSFVMAEKNHFSRTRGGVLAGVVIYVIYFILCKIIGISILGIIH